MADSLSTRRSVYQGLSDEGIERLREVAKEAGAPPGQVLELLLRGLPAAMATQVVRDGVATNKVVRTWWRRRC